MKKIIIVAMMLVSAIVYGETNEKDHVVIMRPQKTIEDLEVQIKDTQDTVNKIYSMVAEFHIEKFGIKRYELVTHQDK